ncbi:hypothetical protein FRC17_009743 [Serendipita sp. 399]|nr:hypothetical protein FRC17_009743 [Serendipita sp. 399]
MRMGPRSQKNIWVAASDGDLERVQDLIEEEGMNIAKCAGSKHIHPNACSSILWAYRSIRILGGDVNITDEDGDTPLYTAESMEVAKWLVDHGAVVQRVNSEGVSPAQHLYEEYPAIARFLDPTIGQSQANGTGTEDEVDEGEGPSEYAQEQLTEVLTERMMQSVAEIMARAAEEGFDPEEELAALVRKTVLESLDAGEGLVEEAADPLEDRGEGQVKRQRTDNE